MPNINLAGPTYSLRSGADVQRVVGWMPVQVESGTGKGGAVAYLKQQPGLRKLATVSGPIRGLCVARDKLYAVGGETLYMIGSDWSASSRGTVGLTSSLAEMAVNNTQLCIAQGETGFVLDLDTNVLTQLTSDEWRGSNRAELLDGYGVFAEPDSQQFYLTAIQDFTVFDALDFASAEGSTGKIKGHLIKHRELLIFKDNSAEVWYDSGAADFALSRNDGANIECGLSATYSLRKVDGRAFWLGREHNGAAVVYMMATYTPQRVSSHALEEQLSALDDLSGATAWTYQQEGLVFYVLNVPGLSTTWVYEVASGIWHERAEWVDGDYRPWRATCHAYVYGKHVVGDADGNLYELDPELGNNDGDPLIRDRITPHAALSSLAVRRFGPLQIDCTVARGVPAQDPKLMLRYSNDGGRNWGNWRYLSLGKIGETKTRARATMLGSARDRVWQIRVTDDVQCDLISAVVDEV
jgi:hypothetical protein